MNNFTFTDYKEACPITKEGMRRYKIIGRHEISEPPLQVNLMRTMIAVCRQLRIPSQWQIDQLTREQASDALQPVEDDNDNHNGLTH